MNILKHAYKEKFYNSYINAPLSHPLLSPSPTFNLSQHQSLFKWVISSHEVAKVLEFQLQLHSLQRNPRADLLQNGLVGSPCSPRGSQESSPTPQFKSINSSALSLLHSPTLTSIHDPGRRPSMGSHSQTWLKRRSSSSSSKGSSSLIRDWTQTPFIGSSES